MAQEVPISIDALCKLILVFKFDLSKSFHIANWIYLRLIMIHLDFSHSFVS